MKTFSPTEWNCDAGEASTPVDIAGKPSTNNLDMKGDTNGLTNLMEQMPLVLDQSAHATSGGMSLSAASSTEARGGLLLMRTITFLQLKHGSNLRMKIQASTTG